MMDQNLDHFLYPPDFSSLSFNHRDIVNVSWVTSETASSPVDLYLWIQTDVWQNVYSAIVPPNGSILVPLDLQKTPITQARFIMEYSDIRNTAKSFDSADFVINHDASKEVTTWSNTTPTGSLTSLLAAPTSTDPAAFSSEPLPTASPAPSLATNSVSISALNPSGSSAALLTSMLSNRLSPGATAGIVVGVAVVCVALMSLLIWSVKKKRRKCEVDEIVYTNVEVEKAPISRGKGLPRLPVEKDSWSQTPLARIAPHYRPDLNMKVVPVELIDEVKAQR